MNLPDGKSRCHWANPKNERYIRYHDQEWGLPVHDDRKLFEMLILECFQAGLSWECVLNKREAFREAFDGFDLDKVCGYGEEKLEALCNNPQVIRNRLKIQAAVTNAQVFRRIQQECGSFSDYLWHWTEGKVIYETGRTSSELSDILSKDLKKRGMKFVGTTVIYAYLQAVGVIYSHEEGCFKNTMKTQWKKESAMTDVVAALIWDKNKFMICQRPAHKARGLLWEFVGGKVEPGETKEKALIRECREELAVTIQVGSVFMEVVHEYPDMTIKLTLFNATIAEGVPQMLEHSDIRWISPEEISQYDFCPADTEILKILRLEAFTQEELQVLAEKAVRVIPERVRYYAPIIGVDYGRITIRSQKTRWGSCSSKGNLNFNCLLMLTPLEAIDSVVVHELCHRKHMNHSKDFYAEVERVFPDYQKWNKWLKESGRALIRRLP